MTSQRTKILVANEKYVAKGGISDSDDEAIGSDDDDSDFEDEDDIEAKELS